MTMRNLNPQTERLASLDLLRLISALMVVVYHYFYRGPLGDPALMNTSFPEAGTLPIFGILGLTLFFTISGFVIPWSAENKSVLNFSIARIIRLYPGFVVCMTITFIVMWCVQNPVFPATFPQYLANLFIVSRIFGQPFMDGVYWSIVFEIIFYGWIAVLIATGLFKRSLVAVAACWLALSLFNEAYIQSSVMRVLFLTQYIPFFMSGLLYYLLRRDGITLAPAIVGLWAMAQSLHSLATLRSELVYDYGHAMDFWPMMLAGILMHLTMIGTLFAGRLVPASKFIFLLGGITYPLYLLHQQIGYVLIDSLEPSIGRWPAAIYAIVVMLSLSAFIWAVAERPAQKVLKSWLFEWLPKKAGALYPPALKLLSNP